MALGKTLTELGADKRVVTLLIHSEFIVMLRAFTITGKLSNTRDLSPRRQKTGGIVPNPPQAFLGKLTLRYSYMILIHNLKTSSQPDPPLPLQSGLLFPQ